MNAKEEDMAHLCEWSNIDSLMYLNVFRTSKCLCELVSQSVEKSPSIVIANNDSALRLLDESIVAN